MLSTSWTDDRIDRLKRLWADGLSASQIVAELGGTTRSAVLGKVYRLALAGRAPKPGHTGPRVVKRRARRHDPLVIGPTIVAAPAAPEREADHPMSAQRCAIAELTPRTCRWPIGTPGEPDFCFCGGRALKGAPYCATHMRAAYRPAEPSKPRDTRAA